MKFSINPTDKLIIVKEEAIRQDGVLVLKVVSDLYRGVQAWLTIEGIEVHQFINREGGNILLSGVIAPTNVIIYDICHYSSILVKCINQLNILLLFCDYIKQKTLKIN